MSEADPKISKPKGDLFSKFDALIQQREGLLSTGVRDPFSLVMEEVRSPTVAVCNGKETILLGTYNYMGMTFDDDVIADIADSACIPTGEICFRHLGRGGPDSVVLLAEPAVPQNRRGDDDRRDNIGNAIPHHHSPAIVPYWPPANPAAIVKRKIEETS